jgi:hypothetical protein
MLEQHQSEQAYNVLQRLAATFPTSSYVVVRHWWTMMGLVM